MISVLGRCARYGCVGGLLVSLLAGCGGDNKIAGSPVSNQSPGNAQQPAADTPAPASSPAALADQPYADPVAYSGNAGDSIPVAQAVEAAAVTHHQLTLPGGPLNYTATAGHLVATDPTTGNKATIFYTAYTRDGVPPGSRPVTFTYNGGPGASSIFLHMAAWSPVRIVTNAPAVPDPNTLPTTLPMISSTDSLLDTTDLVYIDPPGTGFSEAIAPATNSSFWGADPDGRILEGFVQRYLSVNKRQQSPLYLYGESYGTPRTDILTNLLEENGTPVTGIILQSACLDYNADYSVNADAYFLPSFAAVGAYLGLVPPVPSLASYVTDVQSYAGNTLVPLVQNPQYTAYDATTAAQLAQYTGIATGVWENPYGFSSSLLSALSVPGIFNDPASLKALGVSAADVVIYQTRHFLVNASGSYTSINGLSTGQKYAKNFLPGQLIGRYDGRVKVPANSAWAKADGDPSDEMTSTFGPQGTAYLASTLKYTNAQTTYIQLSNSVIGAWNWSHDGGANTLGVLDTVPDLQSALLLNPTLKVLVMNGYHDLATPLFATETSLARLGSQPNLTTTFYDGGHMIYLNEASRAPMKTDLVNFYQTPGVLTAVPAVPGSAVAGSLASGADLLAAQR